MKFISALIFALFLAAAVAAQDAPSAPAAQDWVSQSLKRGAWELGVLAGGGTGLGKSSGTQFVYAGGRAGLILTGNHLPGFLHGNFEWAVDVMPLYAVLPPARPDGDGGCTSSTISLRKRIVRTQLVTSG